MGKGPAARRGAAPAQAGGGAPAGRVSAVARTAAVCLAVLVVAAPYARALAFPAEQLAAAAILLALLGVVYAFWRRAGAAWAWDRTDALAGAVALAYAAATFVAVNPRAAVQEDLKAASYAAAFWMARRLARAGLERWLAGAVAGSGAALVGFAFLVRAGAVEWQDAWYGGRMGSALQYPNALAAYLAAALFCGLGLAGGARGRGGAAWRWGGGLTAAVAAAGLVLTYSRGAWVVAPLAGALMGAAVRARRGRAAWRAAGAGALAVVAAGMALAAAVPAVRERLAQVTLHDYSIWSRVQFTRDALAIWRDHPLVGAGGGAWQSLYMAYQSYGYFTTQAHDQPAQVLVETGLLGMAAWIALWAAVLTRGWRRTARGGAEAAVLGGILAAVAFLLLHSCGDFALSLGAVSLPLWILGGLLAGPAEAPAAGTAAGAWATGAAATPAEPAQGARGDGGEAAAGGGGRARRALAGVAVAGGCGAGAILALILLAGLVMGNRGAQAFAAGDFLAAEEWLDRAAALDPLAAPFRADRAQVELARLDVGLDADLGLAERRAREAVARDRYNAGFHALLAEVLWRRGDRSQAVSELGEAARLHPFAARRWEALVQAAVQAAAAPAAGGGVPPGVQPGLQSAEARRFLAIAEEARRELRRRALSIPPIVPATLRTPATTAGIEAALAGSPARRDRSAPDGAR